MCLGRILATVICGTYESNGLPFMSIFKPKPASRRILQTKLSSVVKCFSAIQRMKSTELLLNEPNPRKLSRSGYLQISWHACYIHAQSSRNWVGAVYSGSESTPSVTCKRGNGMSNFSNDGAAKHTASHIFFTRPVSMLFGGSLSEMKCVGRMRWLHAGMFVCRVLPVVNEERSYRR